MTHEELRTCCSMLLIFSTALPERQLVPLVCKRLFGRMSILDVRSSDMRAKAILFDSAFKVLKAMIARKTSNLNIAVPCDMLVDMCVHVLDVHDELWKAIAIKVGLDPLPSATIGSVFLPPVRDRFEHLDRMSIIRSALESHQELMITALSHFLSLSPPSPEGLGIFAPILHRLVCRMLDTRKHSLAGMRTGALGFAYAVLNRVINQNRNMHGGGEGEEEGEGERYAESVGEIMGVLSESVAPSVDAIISMHYPIRAKEKEGGGEGSGDRNEKGARIYNSVSEDATSMAVRLFCHMGSAFLARNTWTWNKLCSFIFKPYGESKFWIEANGHYRLFGYKVISSILKVLPSGIRSGSRSETGHADLVETAVHAWQVCMLDWAQSKHVVPMTAGLLHVLKNHGCNVEGAPSDVNELRADRDGILRGKWLSYVAQISGPSLPASRVGVGRMKDLLAFVVASKKSVLDSGKRVKQWRQSVCNMILCLMNASRDDARTRHVDLTGHLKFLCEETAVAFDECLHAFLGAHGSTSNVDALASARIAIKESLLGKLPDIFQHTTDVAVGSRGQCSPSPSLHALATLAFEHVPGLRMASKPFMTAFYEMLASAVAPTHPHGDGEGEGGGEGERVRRALNVRLLCHCMLGTYIRRWIQRSGICTKQNLLVGDNVMHFVGILFSQHSMRSGEALRLFMPQIVGPLVDFVCGMDDPRIRESQKLNLFVTTMDALATILASSCDAVPPFADLETCLSTSFQSHMDLLTRGEPFEAKRFACVMQTFWHAMLRGAGGVVCRLAGLSTDDVSQVDREPGCGVGVATSDASARVRSKLFRLMGRPQSLGALDALYKGGTKRAGSGGCVGGALPLPSPPPAIREEPNEADMRSVIRGGLKILALLHRTPEGTPWCVAGLKAWNVIARTVFTPPEACPAKDSAARIRTEIVSGYCELHGLLALLPEVSSFPGVDAPTALRLANSAGADAAPRGTPCPTQGATPGAVATQGTVAYGAPASQLPTQEFPPVGSGAGASKKGGAGSVVTIDALRAHAGCVVNFLGFVASRDPPRGTKAFKTQPHFMAATLGDERGRVRLIATGTTAQRLSQQLDGACDAGHDAPVVVLKAVRVVCRQDTGQPFLQALTRTVQFVNPNVKAAHHLRAWVRSQASAGGGAEGKGREGGGGGGGDDGRPGAGADDVEALKRLTGKDGERVRHVLKESNGDPNRAANLLLDG